MTIIEFNLVAIGFFSGVTTGLWVAYFEKKSHEKECEELKSAVHGLESND